MVPSLGRCIVVPPDVRPIWLGIYDWVGDATNHQPAASPISQIGRWFVLAAIAKHLNRGRKEGSKNTSSKTSNLKPFLYTKRIKVKLDKHVHLIMDWHEWIKKKNAPRIPRKLEGAKKRFWGNFKFGPNLFLEASDGYNVFMTLLCLDGSFTSASRALISTTWPHWKRP